MTKVPARAVEIKILTSNSTRTVLDALVPGYELESGNRVVVESGSAKLVMQQINEGATADIAILGNSAIDALAAAGRIDPASRRAFSRSRIGVAVRKGSPRPDIGSVETFRRALLDAKSICHTVHGASGMYVPILLERLGILDEMTSRMVTRPGGYIARLVAEGEAELAIQQLPELLAVPGTDVVGPIPDAVQKTFETTAGIFAGARQPGAAAALVAFLLKPAFSDVFQQKGFEPPIA